MQETTGVGCFTFCYTPPLSTNVSVDIFQPEPSPAKFVSSIIKIMPTTARQSVPSPNPTRAQYMIGGHKGERVNKSKFSFDLLNVSSADHSKVNNGPCSSNCRSIFNSEVNALFERWTWAASLFRANVLHFQCLLWWSITMQMGAGEHTTRGTHVHSQPPAIVDRQYVPRQWDKPSWLRQESASDRGDRRTAAVLWIPNSTPSGMMVSMPPPLFLF